MKFIETITSYFPSFKGKRAYFGLIDYLRNNPIEIRVSECNDESGHYYLAESTNISDKHIIVAAPTKEELEFEIKEQIFSLFKVPTYYSKHEDITIPFLVDNKLKVRYASA
jgi:hypothetical protein